MGMKPRDKQQILGKIRRHVANIAAERDKLRETYDELSDIMESTEDGLKEIEWGIDRLSEYI